MKLTPKQRAKIYYWVIMIAWLLVIGLIGRIIIPINWQYVYGWSVGYISYWLNSVIKTTLKLQYS